jgi:tetratricopeptide (TPR) repeat protein
MYFQVPGKPIGFGDKQLAENFLLKGIELSDNGMIANFFAGQFYFDQKDYQKAMNYFETAKKEIFKLIESSLKKGLYCK